MSKIKNIWAREILDSRGVPTIEAACQLENGMVSVSSVPAGTSMGSYEALELRDKDPKRFKGMGVLNAVNTINKIISPNLTGKDPSNQKEIDKLLLGLDGTKNKQKLGANAILAVSEVVCKSASILNQKSLYDWVSVLFKEGQDNFSFKIPTPIFNMINGGLHGAGNLDFQEFHLIPVSDKNYGYSLQAACEIYMTIGNSLKQKGAIHSVGDEGGYAPNLFTNADALEIMVESIRDANYKLGRDVSLGLDVAANSIFKNGAYSIKDKTSALDENALIQFYQAINTQYHLSILEDPLHEDSWDGWQRITKLMSGEVIVVGDDLLVTNPERLEKAIKAQACNAILVKPNQIGTITETIDVIKMAKKANWKVVVSHRSGETNDWFIADFAVGVNADFVKFGAPSRGERVAKYNRLLSIETEIIRKQ